MVFGSGSSFKFEFRFWKPRHSTRSVVILSLYQSRLIHTHPPHHRRPDRSQSSAQQATHTQRGRAGRSAGGQIWRILVVGKQIERRGRRKATALAGSSKGWDRRNKKEEAYDRWVLLSRDCKVGTIIGDESKIQSFKQLGQSLLKKIGILSRSYCWRCSLGGSLALSFSLKKSGQGEL